MALTGRKKVDPDISNGFAFRLMQIMNEKHIGKVGLAKELEVSVSSVYQWLEGTRFPDTVCLVAMSDFFKVPMGWLITGEERYTVRKEKK